MDRGVARDDGPRPDRDMTAKQSTADERCVIADLAVVPDVRVRHQQAVVTDDGRGTIRGAAMNGHSFPQHAAVADHAVAQAILVGVVLGRVADDGMGVDFALGTDRRVAHDDDGGGDAAVGTDADRGRR